MVNVNKAFDGQDATFVGHVNVDQLAKLSHRTGLNRSYSSRTFSKILTDRLMFNFDSYDNKINKRHLKPIWLSFRLRSSFEHLGFSYLDLNPR